MTNSDYIKQFRKDYKLSQVKLSELSGIARPTISDIENGKYKNSQKEKRLIEFIRHYKKVKEIKQTAIYARNQKLADDINKRGLKAIENMIRQQSHPKPKKPLFVRFIQWLLS